MKMVERVAFAIAKELTGGTPSMPQLIDYKAALAALKAMRELADPEHKDRAVSQAGGAAMMATAAASWEVEDVWRAIIDAAIKEAESE